MDSIVFFDTEIEYGSGRVLDIGGVRDDGSIFHSCSKAEFARFIDGAKYICGHNIINHDLKYMQDILDEPGSRMYIDTLHLSPLLFPAKPYHRLLKDDKLQTDEPNNPLNDSIKARDLFHDEAAAFRQTDEMLQRIFYCLLGDKKEFASFFEYIGYNGNAPKAIAADAEKAIRSRFHNLICYGADLGRLIEEYPIELAYSLALINTRNRYSITPPWVLRSYPAVEKVMFLLRNNPCLMGCDYCNEALDINKGLKRFFGFDSYRTYAGEPLQERAVRAAVMNKSLLAVFPTGGGKSVTFQVPALMSGANSKGLTVVISPLQSLMKDQVDNLEKADITEAVTINGLLDPIERSKSFERVEDGSASILYISPESLRSKSIERLLLGRNMVRFVIDEAHCFSAWGQDFRVDYLYIGDFIKAYQEKKNLEQSIPVSCFTATAKQKVIEDIRDYFRNKLNLELEVFTSEAARSNLHYKVFHKNSDEEKYNTLRDLLDEKKCPTIVYVSRTRRAYMLAARLTEDGYEARPYHGKMDKREKTENQEAFMRGDVRIMVATSAFGMGVDKKDVGMVIHYEISDSLENYVQEAGRAGRDEKISADCYVLFNDEDLSKHFILLNQTKLSLQEIQQVWKAIKEITRLRSRVSQSALEIARKAGWDDNVTEIETRVTTAIAALEDAGYIRRGQNMPRPYANSILVRNAEEAINRINDSGRFDFKQKQKAVRIIKNLIASRSRKNPSNEEAESRIDYISDRLGIVKEEVIQIVNLLREEGILADARDLVAFIKKKESKNRSLGILNSHMKLERFLLDAMEEKGEERVFHIKELNSKAEQYGCEDTSPAMIKTILNFWAIKNYIKRQFTESSRNHVKVVCMIDREILDAKITKRHELAQFILDYLFEKSSRDNTDEDDKASTAATAVMKAKQAEDASGAARQEEAAVEFSVLELKGAFEKRLTLFCAKAAVDDVEDALFYLSRIDALNIEGGFMVVYNAMSIERLEADNRKRYKVEDYQKLKQYYENKVQQIHIVGEYARKMLSDYKDALQFVNDYFRLNYSSFLSKYFKGSRQNEIKRNITPEKFRQLFGELSPSQLKIINDSQSKLIVVAAGPGSGKTRVLVHKLASLLLMEDVKHEQLLMVTFSRAAATEFKKRLLKLIGNAAAFVEIKTFHSYCFDLLGRVGTLEKSDDIIRETVRKIRNGEVEANRITKAVLVIDEAQDMDADEYELINALMEHNEEMRVIAVGDDDQNIYSFRGSKSEYMGRLITERGAVLYELVENYRSKSNLVDFTNQYVRRMNNRLKSTPIVAMQGDYGIIRLVRYKSSNMVTPFVDAILKAELSGTTCAMTNTNDEAMEVAGLLLKHGMPAKLIQTNESFSLYNLLEIRCFFHFINASEDVYIISGDAWGRAKRRLADSFAKSPNLELCMGLINSFEAANPIQKYRSDLEIFIRESRIEDFYKEETDTIFVSTMHKAKGREFDNVFLMLNMQNDGTDDVKRLLYVAMTRAKSNLEVHYNGNYLNALQAENLTKMADSALYQPPAELAKQLTHKDIWLDNFIACQSAVKQVACGDELIVDGCCCRNLKGQEVVRFSKGFAGTIEYMKDRNYAPMSAIARYIVLWRKEDSEQEIRIILPELTFAAVIPAVKDQL